MAGEEAILHEALGRWRDAVGAHEPERVAAGFTPDAIFQGLHPYGVGREAVAAYYAAQPAGLAADYRILETRRPADGLVLGYLAVDFTFPDRPALHVNLAVLLRRTDDGWLIAHYQVSRLD
ncbi:SgcJ/EcaC family oxidoreductase [Dactylosporangium sp. NPDC049140]|uniref:SgcJ/EcaC family oxidoreductase n=1 Tax=Dactylosporangium sp. NPDC049140 TaxID=3155647 RepID=UPI0033FF245B